MNSDQDQSDLDSCCLQNRVSTSADKNVVVNDKKMI